MRLSDIMSSPVETIGAGEAVAQARERMRRSRIHHLVVKDGARIVGVVSERDLRGRADDTPLADLCDHDAVVASPHTTVRQAANLLRGRSIGCVPILDGGRLIGMVTIADILETLGKGVQRPVVMGKRWTLKHRGPRRKLGPA